MTQWVGWLRSVSAEAPAALVSVLASEGSAPRGAGTRMLVRADGQEGTIGGGALEYRAVEQARALLAHPPGTWRVQDYPLGPLLGQCCGGRVRLLVERVDPSALGWLRDVEPGWMLVTRLGEDRIAREVLEKATPGVVSARGERPGAGAVFTEPVGRRPRPVYLFGAGHVGQAIARHMRGLPLHLAWFDTRPEQEAIDGVTVVDEEHIEQCVADAPGNAAILILTHDHGLDYHLTLAALRRDPVAFVGLIGSATKGARFRSRLARDGIAPDRLARLTSPIGIAGVRGKEPDVIAISTLAQLLALDAA
ncbi:xanthine dehydrogenase accessory protein XdhC [Novosphingobium album (ex Liu et al. 2023)]|uniref:Xanthine dehydrogenase accessory protein XdhC n=1 Tax=Novosphingobium album (ex Liu et al. 2023) TaxID=3031130 RepID=A0ABT5WMP7_9SPHN|nr:xanthine dehydrogenase accessory protein XdhC [Novosphingobium album (ex Liu et al. 2023)]MDE8651321.1 xanthine dehydrogenase accessory protein XdhC [Novosphingobium album (ex Liu et al. 2023)]